MKLGKKVILSEQSAYAAVYHICFQECFDCCCLPPLFSLCHHRCLGVLDTGGFEFPTIDGGRKPLVGGLNPFPFSLDYPILTFRDLLQA